MGWLAGFWLSEVHIAVGVVVAVALFMVTITCLIVQIDNDFKRKTQRDAARILLAMPVVGPLLAVFWIMVLPFVALFGLFKGGAFLARRAELNTLFKTGVQR